MATFLTTGPGSLGSQTDVVSGTMTSLPSITSMCSLQFSIIRRHHVAKSIMYLYCVFVSNVMDTALDV